MIRFVWLFGLVLISTAINFVSAYKVAIFVPDVSSSQILCNYRVAEALHKAGHQVTLIRLMFAAMPRKEHPLSKGITEWRFHGFTDQEQKSNATKVFHGVYEEMPLFSKNHRALLSLLSGMMIDSCEVFVQNKELLSRLRNANFDIAFADMAGLCTVGFIHYAKIPTWIWLNNAPLIDFVAEIIGVHSPSSYVPSLMAQSTDEMTFFQRVQSFLTWSIMPAIFKKSVAVRQTDMFRKHIDPNFPRLDRIAANCPLVMVNADEMFASPRPVLHKIIYIGGIGVADKNAKPLVGEFKEIEDKAKNIIVFSFGSVANATLMPQSWKDAICESFRKFPNVDFIMRYELDDLKGKLSPNVHTYSWLPQIDLMHSPKTRALITHSGFNSLQEAIIAGTPLIAIPLFGDQMANAKLAEKHHFGVVLKKSEMSEKFLTNAIKTILEDDGYSKSVKRMRTLIQKKPFKPDELLVRWTEFLAEVKDLSNLTPYSIKLNFIEYYSIDVVLFLLGIIFTALFVIYKLARYIVCLFCKIFKRNGRQEKKNKKVKKQ